MKKTRRFIAMAAALTLTACTAAPVFMMNASAAATANKITISGEVGTGHTYTAYQIFTGSIEEGKTELSSPTWAAGDDKFASFLAELKNDETIGDYFKDATTVAAVAKALSNTTNFADDSSNVKAFAKLVYTNKNLVSTVNEEPTDSIDIESAGDGYYLVIDETVDKEDTNTTTTTTTAGAKSYYILKCVDASEGVEITAKADKPTVVKKVKENVKTGAWEDATKYGAQYNDVADYNIGDTVPFELIATLPATNFADYEHYYIKFTDHLDKGFKVPTGNYTVTLGTGDPIVFAAPELATTGTKTGTTEINNKGRLIVTDNGDAGIDITVEIYDVKSYEATAGSTVKVDYSAVLDTDAVIGKVGNYNDVYLSYSNNPRNTGDGNKAPGEGGENTGKPDGDRNGTSDTPKDGVVVFTYELDINKYDGGKTENDKLAGAKFVLKNADGKYVKVGADKKVAGWNDKPSTLTGLTDEAAIVAAWEAASSDVSVFTSSASELIKIVGLDDGTYTLEEIKAPDGYNKLTASYTLTVSATTRNSQGEDAIGTGVRAGDQLSALKLKYMLGEGDELTNDGACDTGIVKLDVANNSGATLPSTGGMGTYLFYGIGGAFAVGAGLVLATKKRVNK